MKLGYTAEVETRREDGQAPVALPVEDETLNEFMEIVTCLSEDRQQSLSSFSRYLKIERIEEGLSFFRR